MDLPLLPIIALPFSPQPPPPPALSQFILNVSYSFGFPAVLCALSCHSLGLHCPPGVQLFLFPRCTVTVRCRICISAPFSRWLLSRKLFVRAVFFCCFFFCVFLPTSGKWRKCKEKISITRRLSFYFQFFRFYPGKIFWRIFFYIFLYLDILIICKFYFYIFFFFFCKIFFALNSQ